MNKFEKLIEYIINDEDQKARELFHTIVVEKSRDIYESIMDDEQSSHPSDDQVKGLTDEIGHEESAMGEGDEEFGDDEGSEFGGEEEGGEFDGEEPAEFGGEEGEAEAHGEIEDQVMNIDAKLDELLAKFDEIMGGEEPAGEEEFGYEEPGMEQGEEEFGGEEGMMEGENPFAKSGKSGKSGSAASGKSGSAASGKSGSAKMEAAKAGSAVSGKSGSAASGKSGSAASGKSGSGKKSTSELMREYVDKIQDMNLTGDSEGTIVGANTGAKDHANINKKSEVGPGADFGGTEKNLVKGGEETNPDGRKAFSKPTNEYSKGEGKLPGAGKFQNVPGGDKKLKGEGHDYQNQGDSEGENAGAKDTMGRKINTKSELGQAGRPTGKK